MKISLNTTVSLLDDRVHLSKLSCMFRPKLNIKLKSKWNQLSAVYLFPLPFTILLYLWTQTSLSRVCKSVHHRTIQINHQPDATIFQFIILTFIYSSTCFGRFPAHHQALNDYNGSLWFYLCIVVTVVLFSWSGRLYITGPTTNTARRYEGKTRGCHCSHLSSWWWEGKRPKHVEL